MNSYFEKERGKGAKKRECKNYVEIENGWMEKGIRNIERV